jgi:hypothetical protein
MARYYGLDDATQRLTEVRPILEALRDDARRLRRARDELLGLRRSNGAPGAAAAAEQHEHAVVAIAERMRNSVAQLEAWNVELRDIETGLIDFPALANGRPIWLCWRFGEDGIGWWHDVNVGFAGRRPLIELE